MTALAPLAIVAQQVVWRLSPLAVVILSLLLIALFVWLDRRKKPVQAGPLPAQVTATPKVEAVPAVAFTEPAVPAPVASMPLVEAPVVSELVEPVQPEVQPEAARSVELPVVEAPADNLEIIEGIGPKISSVLQQAGVKTFAQLAQMDPTRISEILLAAGMRLADPHSWPEQARLAAAGNVEALKELQSHLKAGRVV